MTVGISMWVTGNSGQEKCQKTGEDATAPERESRK